MSPKITNLATKILGSSPVSKVCNYINQDKYTFLMYHGVANDSAYCARNDWLQLDQTSFRQQMVLLKERYNVVSLKDILGGNISSSDTRPKVVITFDDGYANNYNVAYPILKELGLPATIFLVTSYINSDKLFWYDRLFTAIQDLFTSNDTLKIIESFKQIHPHQIDQQVDSYLKENGHSLIPSEEVYDTYRILKNSEINEMAESGLITFGSHTDRHEILTRMTNKEVAYTLKKSYETLQDIPNNVNVFCYPNGWYNNDHVRLCNRIGYDLAVSTKHGIWKPTINDYQIPRWGVGRGLNFDKFLIIISGMLFLLKRIANRVG